MRNRINFKSIIVYHITRQFYVDNGGVKNPKIWINTIDYPVTTPKRMTKHIQRNKIKTNVGKERKNKRYIIQYYNLFKYNKGVLAAYISNKKVTLKKYWKKLL